MIGLRYFFEMNGVYAMIPFLAVAWLAHLPLPSDGMEMEMELNEEFSLPQTADATHIAKRSGAWSSPETWRAGQLPRTGSRVLVPHAVTVTVDRECADTALDWLRVDGLLRFPARRDTGLKLCTLFISSRGMLTVADSANRLAPENHVRFIFTERGKQARTADPLDIQGGLISAGTVQVFGAEKTGFAPPSDPPRKGATRVTFAEPSLNWAKGDKLLFPGVDPLEDQDEERQIVRVIDGGRTFEWNDSLLFDHLPPAGAIVPVANLSRNVSFESESTSPVQKRAHIMIIHKQSGTVFDGAALIGLGRTRADAVHTSPETGAEGHVVPGSDANTLGRYALHFHIRKGASRTLPPHLVRNCVISDSPKHGLVNHGAHLIAEGNVSHRVAGSHFFCENGSEIGTFRRNIAVRSTGSGEALKSRMYSYDLGHTGHGFWMQGGGVEVTDCHAYGHREAAFIYHMKPGMIEDGSEVHWRTPRVFI